MFEAEATLDIKWRHEILRRDGQFTGLLTSTGLAMKRHREENRLTVVTSGLRGLANTIARFGNLLAMIKATQTWRMQTICGYVALQAGLKETLSRRRVVQGEAFVRVRLVLKSYLHGNKWTAVTRWKHHFEQASLRFRLEAEALARTEAADGALAKAMLRSHSDRHEIEVAHERDVAEFERKLDEVSQTSAICLGLAPNYPDPDLDLDPDWAR